MSIKENYGTSQLEKEFGELTFGNAIYSYRLGEEKTQKEFASFLGISSQSLCDIEKGRRIPSINRASKIAKKLKEPVKFWIQLALQDMIRKEKLDFLISVA
ncbi:MAG: helix-turn-helix transcriptional regulator [SAR324 cluster bacterium]|nr:helix-turn-helix transcriptional regulator [SAR324 cluster bacterium]